MRSYDVKNEPIVISKYTMDRLLQTEDREPREKAGDLLALYTFYYYTAKWQDTLTARATGNYVRKALGWGEKKLAKVRATLLKLGFIEDVVKGEPGKFDAHYVHVHLFYSAEDYERIARACPSHDVGKPGSGKVGINTRETPTGNSRRLLKETPETVQPPETKKKITRPPNKYNVLSRFVLARQHEVYPNKVKTVKEEQVNKGEAVLRKLVTLDGWAWCVVRPVVLWALGDKFWGENMLSCASLRKKSRANDQIKFTNIHRQWASHGKPDVTIKSLGAVDGIATIEKTIIPDDKLTQVLSGAWAKLTGQKPTNFTWEQFGKNATAVRRFHRTLPGDFSGSQSANSQKVLYFFPTALTLGEAFGEYLQDLGNGYRRVNPQSLNIDGKIWKQFVIQTEGEIGMSFETGERM
jgi:hypothetical protein